MIDFAAAHGLRDPDQVNPARIELLRDVLGSARPTVHFRAAPLAEVPSIFGRLASEPDSVTNAIRFLMLTATRLRETLDCRWAEISFDTATWTIPPERNKVGREFEIPLSSEAIAILKVQLDRRCSDVVFPGRHGSPLASSSIGPVLARVGNTNGTLHGFRSSFRDWCGEIGDVPRHIAEHALNHVVGGTEGAYRRMTALEARRKVMEQYAGWLNGREAGAKVIRLRKRAAE